MVSAVIRVQVTARPGSGSPGASSSTSWGAPSAAPSDSAHSAASSQGIVALTNCRTGSGPCGSSSRSTRARLKAGTIRNAIASSISSGAAVSGTVQATRKASVPWLAPK